MKTGEKLGPYNLVQRLGSGGFGEVWKATDTRSLATVAVKIIEPGDEEDLHELLNDFFQEIQSWSAAGGHPHIHLLRKAEIHANRLLLVSDCADGSLRKWLKQQ